MIEDLPIFKFILFNGVETWELPQSPDGWEESFIEWERSTRDLGIIRNYSIPLKWTLDGAFFLRNSFYRKGIQAFTSLTIKKLVPADLTYIDFYIGTIDYSTLVDNYVTVEASIMDSGMASRIKAFNGTLFEIPLDGPDSIEIEFQGIALQEKAVFLTKSWLPSTANARFNYMSVELIDQPESKIPTVPVRTSPVVPSSSTETIPANDAWFFQSPTSQVARAVGEIQLHIEVNSGISNSWSLDFVTADSVAIVNVVNIGTFTIPVFPAPDYDLSFPFDKQISIGVNDKLWIRLSNNGGNTNTAQTIITSFTLEYLNKAGPSLVRGMRADKVFENLIQRVSGTTNKTQSSLLASDFKDFYYISGTSLRGLPAPKLKINLQDFVKDWYSIACAGLGVENEFAVLERRDYFFRKSQKIDTLGPIQNATFEVQQDYIINTIKVGSKDVNVDDINGRFEFNSEVQWQTPITKISQEYEILTASRTDAYGIEFTRIDFFNKETTDSRADNEAFIIDVNIIEGFGNFPALRADRYLSASGSPAIESVYNLRLSPKQNLLRHNYWIASAMNGVENFFINFSSALKNPDLITTDLSGKTVIESQNIYIQDLGDKLYLPVVATVQTKYAKSLFTVINNSPYGYLEFTWLDNTYRGYILSASFNPANYEQKEFKLLLTPDNNLLTLIR